VIFGDLADMNRLDAARELAGRLAKPICLTTSEIFETLNLRSGKM